MKTICLIGRPNTGKSSIFNCLVGETKSIIMDMPGITRDRIYGQVTYQEKTFSIIDTGGLAFGHDNFEEDILAQASFAMDESDLILFVVDGKTELNQSDYRIRDLLHKSKKEVIVVVNKIDNLSRENDIYPFYELGFTEVIAVSAAHKRGLTNLLDRITKEIPVGEKLENEAACRFCFIGRPNTGKSSLVNALLNENRAIVSEVAGTTRDATDTKFFYHNIPYVMVDTAGIRKRGKIYENIEKYSLLRALKAMENSDVCVLVINAEEGLIEQDKHIAGMAVQTGKALVICVNKWDTIKNPNEEIKKWQELFQYDMPFVSYVHTVFVSAKTKKRLGDLMPEIITAYENHHKDLPNKELNEVVQSSYQVHIAPSYKGKRLKIYEVKEEETAPPKFIFYVNDKGLVHFSYERYLENQIRANFDLTGTPIVIKFKNRSD